MHRLPRPKLIPLCLKTPAVRRFLSETYDALSAMDKERADRFHTICESRMRRERPWRVMNQRRRLYACHWAGWRPERVSLRWGLRGRKWLFTHTAPRIGREDATPSEPGR